MSSFHFLEKTYAESFGFIFGFFREVEALDFIFAFIKRKPMPKFSVLLLLL
jgi:hypothetical protein